MIQERANWFVLAIAAIAVLPGALLYYIGLIVLHLWTAHLAWTHLGLFWGIMALCTPILSEIVVIIACCFLWGVWTYPPAPLCILIGLACTRTINFTRSSGAALWAFVLLIPCAVGFAWLAVSYCQTAGIF